MQSKSTFLGTVQDVRGTAVNVSLANESLSGLAYVDGQGYRIGQIGSFVKIPIGYIDLFGIVTQVGASAVPDNVKQSIPNGFRWFTVQLIGEGQRKGRFERGLSQYPTIGDEVHLVSEQDLQKIYGAPNTPFFVKIGNIAGAETIPALVDINKIVTRHCAVVGSTGSGKSTTVASLLSSMSNEKNYPSARIIVLDIHGEYGQALKDRATVFKINAETRNGEKELYIPYWALNFDELVDVSFGGFAGERERNLVLERVLAAKKASITKYPKEGVTLDTLTVDTPIPFSLSSVWYQLCLETFGTFYKDKPGQPKDNLAFEEGVDGQLRGDAQKGIPPVFKRVQTAAGETKINYVPDSANIGQQLHALGSKLRIPRNDFILRPGGWMPKDDGKTELDLESLLQDWVGSEKPITILDLSGVPFGILDLIIGVLLRVLYDALFWARKLSEGGRNRPLMIVMEEAHNYLNDNSYNGLASTIVQRIVKEGRKYGIGAMIVSQRPSEINSTILSQCGTFFALRLSNSVDRGHITSAVTDNLEGLTSMLPILRTGEAIVIGESVKIPMRVLIEAPEKDKRPDSFDPIVFDAKLSSESFVVGGWGLNRIANIDEYKNIVEVWRAQNPNISRILKSKKMERVAVVSSNIASIGYDETNQALEVEFLNGSVYQYFDVPRNEAEEFAQNPTEGSHGKHLAQHIKGKYRYSKL